MIREVVVRTDFCAGLTIVVIATTVARLTGQGLPRFSRAMGWAATAVLLAVCAAGYAEMRPSQPAELLGIVIVAWIAACGAALAVAVVLTPLAAGWDWWKRLVAEWRAAAATHAEARQRLAVEHRRDVEKRIADAARRKADEEYRRSLPPPPTREELEAAVRKKYEDRLRLLDAAKLADAERQAAYERAKQQYLRDLDELLE
jgi:hypothetical protein